MRSKKTGSKHAPKERQELGFVFLLFLGVAVFVSGFAIMAGEILWVREVGLRFGDTVLSASIVIAVFFAFAAGGAWQGGRDSCICVQPLCRFAVVEMLVGVSALGCFFLGNGWISPWLAGCEPITARLAYAVALAAVPSFLSGYGFPFLVAGIVQLQKERVTKAGLFYTSSLVGAALGTLMGGLFLPMNFGYRYTFFLIFAVEISLGFFLLLFARRQPRQKKREHSEKVILDIGIQKAGWFLAGMSGVFSMILEGAVFQYGRLLFDGSIFSVTFLMAAFILSLGAGSGVVTLLRRRIALRVLLLAVLGGVGILCLAYPQILQFALLHEEWFVFGKAGLLQDFLKVFLLFFPISMLAGGVFPLAWELTPQRYQHGFAMGQLLAWNKLACAAGMFVLPFLLMPIMGVYGSFVLVGGAYVSLALYFTWLLYDKKRLACLVIGLLLFGVPVGVISWQKSPILLQEGDRLLAYESGAFGMAAVVDDRVGSRHIILNNSYMLNGTGDALLSQQQEAWLPLLLCKEPKRVLFIGMASGISATAVLDYPVEELVAAELVPEVASMAKAYFHDWNAALFADARVKIVVNDGKSVLYQQEEPLDAVICDLFLHYQDGVAQMYSKEFFTSVLEKLTKNGIFCLWLPAYQIDEEMGNIILRTFREVFPAAILIRGNMDPAQPIIGLIGSPQPLDFSTARLAERLERFQTNYKNGLTSPFLKSVDTYRLCFMGDLQGEKREFLGNVRNTEDLPIIAFESPSRFWRNKKIRGFRLLDWLGNRFLDRNMPSCFFEAGEGETILQSLRAGNYYYAYAVQSLIPPDAPPEEQIQRLKQARKYWKTAQELAPNTIGFSP